MTEADKIGRMYEWYLEGYRLGMPSFKGPKGCSNWLKHLAFYCYEAEELAKAEKKEREASNVNE